jgi:hypothetical protein
MESSPDTAQLVLVFLTGLLTGCGIRALISV